MAPGQTTTSSRRKRTRPQPDQESSSATDAPEITAAVKKRRLNGVTRSSPSKPKGSSTAGSASRVGQNRGAKNGNATGRKPKGRALYDVSDHSSGDDAAKKLHSLPVKQQRPAVKFLSKKPASKKNIYDVPESGDEREPLKQDDAIKENQQPAPSRRRQAKGNLKNSSEQGTTHQDGQIPDKGRATTTQDDNTGQEGAQLQPKRRGRPPKNSGKVDTAISTKKAVKARLQSRTVDTSPRPSMPQLKGILTPQKKRFGRPQKSVAFDEDNEGGAEVFFEDLPSKATKSATGRGSASIQVAKVPALENKETQDDEESEDDEVCAICSKPDSEPPNEIIFCETCDMAVHQKCYNVPVIPEGDWICRTCSQEDVISSIQATPKKQGKSSEVPNIPNFEKHLQSMQRVLLDRCSGNRRIKLQGQTEAYDKAFQLVEQTVLAGEGNSMMVIGARGCGKTTMVEDIILNLRSEHFEEFHVVRLNGFIHTDDKLALKEIWRQLGKEMDLEDDLVNKTNNYADTMASLLALLSHPAEITGTEEGVTSKSVIFIIDEFDLFATHARQTLLYNLFDIAQARKAPIAVLGLTTRIDVVESLEKRVKSRFSHRYVYLSLPKSLPAYWDICRQGLSVDEDDLEAEGFDTSLEGLDEFRDHWDKKIEALRKTPEFEDHLEYHYYTTKSVSALLTSCILPLSVLSPSSLELAIPSSTVGCITLEPSETKLHLLSSLSDLELALLISAARLDIVAHTDTVNFAMAYDEYSSQMGKQRAQSATSGMLALGAGARVWGRSVAAVAWERLVSLGLLIPSGIGGRSNAAHGGLEGKMWKLEVALDEIPSAVELPGILSKWCTQI
ncbi:origin recognition complex subunit 4 C-terminus-domain-containing protein [Biscogniauxia marginata]|nr:origin recognition complex subunit 4 C-terminus-domain-containing protein [Biscogniauxia marginata]